MKRTFKMILALVLSVTLSGCSLITISKTEAPEDTAEAEDETLGRYYLVSFDGASDTVEGQYLRLSEDNEYKLVLGERTVSGTWKLRKGELTLKLDGDEVEGELQDGTIEIKIDSHRCLFMKGKAEAAAYIAEHQQAIPVTMPSTVIPATEEPATEEPTTEEPTTEEPTTEEPTTEEPTTEEPTTEEPTTEEPTTAAPTEPHMSAEPGFYQIVRYEFADGKVYDLNYLLAWKYYIGIQLDESDQGTIFIRAEEPLADEGYGPAYHTLETVDITWTDSELIQNGEGISYEYDDGTLILYEDDERIIFEACDSILTEDQMRWNGTWYGCLYFDEDNVGPTAYLSDTGCALYIVIDLDGEGIGSMTIFEPNEDFGNEMIMSAEVYAIGDTLYMTSGYMELELEETTLQITLDPDYWSFFFSEEAGLYEVEDYYYYRDETCLISFTVKMLPWGMDWPEDQAALLPDFGAYEDSVMNDDLPIDFMLTNWDNY